MNSRAFATMMLLWASPRLLLGAPQTLTGQQEDSPRPRYDLSRLELPPLRRAELKTALEKRDYKRAEMILVEEAEQDPKSFRATNLLEFAGGVFFLDGEYLNSVIAWKKAEAIAPLDERTRFTLAMAYVKLNRQQLAWPELEELAAAHPGTSIG
jgi:tetratricopeptide (TPR) repeat protein